MMSTFLQTDMAARWKPSEGQIAEASATLAAAPAEAVYTAHVLANKLYGFWTEGVVVLPLPGVYANRDEASAATQLAARAIGEATGLACSGGWTRHTADGRWAVFEDILAEVEGQLR